MVASYIFHQLEDIDSK